MLSDEEKKAYDNLIMLKYFTMEKEDKQAIDTILNLIEKQSKEIEGLKEERKKYPIAMNDEQYKKVIELAQKDIKEELDRQINVRMINEEYIERNYISKDKIKAKIEEIDKEIKVKREIAKNPMDRVSGRLLTDNIVELEKTKKVLQSLLEKE